MWVQLRFIVLFSLFSVVISVAHADGRDKSHGIKASADTPESRLIWDLMDQWPFDPSATLPKSEDNPDAIKMTGRILAAALCMKSDRFAGEGQNITDVLNNDFAEVIESMRVFRNGSLTESDDWNSQNAIDTWTFPNNRPTLEDSATTGLVELNPPNGWWSDKGVGSYEGEIRSNEQRIIVSFRGTDDLGEALTAAYRTPVRHNGILYWHGALTYYRSMEENATRDDLRISKWLDKFDAKNKKVYFIGHSLGGATATIAIRDFALRTQDPEDPNYNQYQYAPTLHAIGAPPAVHCSSVPGWLPGGGWIVRFFTRVVFRCRPNRARNVTDYANTVVNVAGNSVPLIQRLNYWVNVRDPSPFQWTPKNWKAWYLFTRAANTLSHVGTLREFYLGSDDQPNFTDRTKEPAWTIKEYTGRVWSSFQNPYDQNWRRLWTDIELVPPKVEFHDQRHYANGMEHFTSGERWWSRLYGPTTNDDSIFAWRRDADGNDLKDGNEPLGSICGERGSYHDGILPYEANVTVEAPIGCDCSSPQLQESDLQSGASKIDITLKNDMWIDDGFEDQRESIIDGLRTVDDSEWNREVVSQLSPDDVVRASPWTVWITLVAAPSYDITANESVAVYLPASALAENIKDLKAANVLEIIAETQSSSTNSSTSTQTSGGAGSSGPLSLIILLLVAGLIRVQRRAFRQIAVLRSSSFSCCKFRRTG